MDDLIYNRNPRQNQPTDQQGENGTAEPKSIKSPSNEEDDGNGCHAEQGEFLEVFHASHDRLLLADEDSVTHRVEPGCARTELCSEGLPCRGLDKIQTQ